ncbi:MAG: hypothetical protein H6990_04150 [Pseudomonadales bacterium]|nr:hypothetical protein [Pseudomonadales bacterium]
MRLSVAWNTVEILVDGMNSSWASVPAPTGPCWNQRGHGAGDAGDGAIRQQALAPQKMV